jgi:hypothetical protein
MFELGPASWAGLFVLPGLADFIRTPGLASSRLLATPPNRRPYCCPLSRIPMATRRGQSPPNGAASAMPTVAEAANFPHCCRVQRREPILPRPGPGKPRTRYSGSRGDRTKPAPSPPSTHASQLAVPCSWYPRKPIPTPHRLVGTCRQQFHSRPEFLRHPQVIIRVHITE